MKKLIVFVAIIITLISISCTFLPCTTCDGTGDCVICDGTGSLIVVTCFNCYGTGDCPDCNGTGNDL